MPSTPQYCSAVDFLPGHCSSIALKDPKMESLNSCVTSKLQWGNKSLIPSDQVRTRRRLSYAAWSFPSFRECQLSASVTYPYPFARRDKSWRSSAMPVNLDKQSSSFSEGDNLGDTQEAESNEELFPRKLTSDELKALLADSERRKIIRKLSEANQYNRFLKRQLHVEEDALTQFKNELAVLELELQALVDLAEEIANSNVTATSRKINGKYIQSHLLSRLEVVHEKVKKQIEDVDALKFQEINLFWVGMAENVQVMGTFDGWTEGEEMSPEYNGEFARFSATLKLRPGRYEIKFLVDGEWQLSPEFPTVGEGMMMNNLLVVE